jgi:cell division protein FtsI (penicillin-binding protein 3)
VKNGHYTPGVVASFVGMAPADQPRFVVAVFAHTPPDGSGGAVAGPVFRDIMQYALARYRVPPTGAKPPAFKISP